MQIANILTLLNMISPEAGKLLLSIIEDQNAIGLLQATMKLVSDSSGLIRKEELQKELDSVSSASVGSW
jgi:hypothetical protein